MSSLNLSRHRDDGRMSSLNLSRHRDDGRMSSLNLNPHLLLLERRSAAQPHHVSCVVPSRQESQ
jgi:hypothetical protein